jgi:FG-GAP repeat/FG-GAP-like repeat
VIRLAGLAFMLTLASAVAQAPSVDLRSEYQARLVGLGAGPAVDAGDVNGDGVPDALVAVAGRPASAFVVFGRRGTWQRQVALDRLQPADGYRVVRPGPKPSSFSAVDAGDVNGDGVPDAIVGYTTEDGSSGEADVVFGRRQASGTIDLTRVTPSDGYRIVGTAGSFAGNAVAAAGDVNGDGVPDALVGAPGPDGAAGSVYVIYGQRQAPTKPIELGSLTTAEGYRIDGSPGDGIGQALAAAGDVNGDGSPDALLGAPSASHAGEGAGSAYVVYGRRSPAASVDLSKAGGWGYRIDGAAARSHAGTAVADAGDVNRDGAPDALVGAPGQADGPPGSAAVVYGRKAPPAATIRVAALAAAAGYTMTDGRPGSGAGYSVANLGDVTGDGVPDAIVGAIGAQSRGVGAAYVVYGRRSAVTGDIDLAALTADRGYAIEGTANAGSSVANAGDVNHDGLDEAWVWAPNDPVGGPVAGATYLASQPRSVAIPQTRRAVVGRSRTVTVTVVCIAPAGSRCVGGVRLIRMHRIVASAGFSVRALARAHVRLRLNLGAAAALRRHGRLRLAARVSSSAEPPAPATQRAGPLLLLARRS